MKGGQAWDNNNSVPVPDVPCGGRHGSSGWKMSRCDFHVVMESSHHGQSPSNICLLCPEADCNSNGCMENHSQSNSNRQHQLTSNEAVSKSYTAKLNPLLQGTDYKWESQCPTSIYSVSLNQKDLNYDDLSKNIDANLAEIDMETFRSEDIHSILALPVMYSGDFQSATHGEQCASVSGSLLGGLELDSSISPRSTSEDEISICKDEPLFSPVKEHPLPDGTISVDSLDCSSLEDHDLVLTCRANKSNYTIAFEGSGTQFSDDSDYQEALGITETAVWQEPDGKRRTVSSKPHTGPMVQSDFAFTTWSKLKRSKEVAKVRGRNIPSATSKSQSLPNLLRHSVLSEKLLNQWASGFGSKGCVPLYDVQSSQSAHSRESSCTDSQQSVSLLKLFIQQRMSNSPECGSTSVSSSRSESSATNVTGTQDKAESLSGSYQLEPISNISDETSQEADKSELPYENYNQTGTPHSPIHSTSENTMNTVICETAETNNNTISPLPSTDNYNVIHPSVQGLLVAEGYVDSEEENSQYFEDSLMDVPPPASKDFFTSPIKEEEEPLETDTSSGDETMKDSKDPFGSDTGSSQESNITKNNKLDGVVQKQGTWTHGVEKINNVFPTGKCNMLLANNACTFNKEDKFPIKCLDFGCQNQSQGTQTKQLNSKDCSPVDGMNAHVSADPNHIQGTKLDILNNVRYSPSRDSSPSSSGYLSSRQGSVERLRHSSQGFINNTNILPNVLPTRKINVIITKPCHRSTQIPVHIRDQAIQTSLLDENGMAVSLTIKETNDENNMESSYLLKLPAKCKDGSRKSSASSDESGSSEKRSIYICYPNYSLPDLSFLRSFATSPEAPEIVYLAPTKHNVPPVSAASSSRPVQERKRPKSCSDFDALSCQPFSHIKDWESLSVLLPADLKSVITKLQDRGNARPLGEIPGACAKLERTSNVKSRDSSPVCTCGDKNKAESNSAGGISNPPLHFCKIDDRKPVRGILRKSSSPSDDKEPSSRLPSHCCSMSTVVTKKQDTRFKRYSLQEPCQKTLDNIPEVNNLMNYLARLKKEGDSEKNDQDESQGVSQNQGMHAQPCNSNLGAGFKQALLNTGKRDHTHPQVARTVSDECHKRMPSPRRGISSNGSSINNSPIRQLSTPPPVDDSNEKEHPCSCSLLSEIPSVEQLQNQLENLLGSSSNLGLVAAALFAAQDGNSGEANHCCSEDTSAVPSCICSKGKKSVKFGAPAVKQGSTPPVLSPCKAVKTCNENIESVKLRVKTEHVKSPDDDGDEMDFPPQEFAVSPSQCSPVTTPSSSQPASVEDLPLSASILHEELNKRTSLVENLQKSVDILIAHFAQARDSRRKIEIGSSALSPSLGHKVLASFCPAMHAILSDGQLPSIPGLLTPLTNSTWRVAEATTKSGRCKREIQELVNHINAEDIFTNIQKFNAFLLGVLNLGCLDTWIGHLCSCESVIKCHYYPTAMLSLLTHQAVSHLKEEFQNMVKPLSSLPFSLELSLVSKDYKSKLSQLSNKEQDFHTGSLPSSPARRNYHMNAKDNTARIQDRNCNLNLIVDKRLKQEVLRNRNPELPMEEFIKRKEEKLNITSKDASEENYMLSLFPGVTVYPFNELRVSPDLEYTNKGQEVEASLQKDNENISGTDATSMQNDILDLDGDSELLYSSTDSGCSSQIDHVSPHLPTASQAVRNNNQKEPEGHMFQKLRQKWEQMTSTPEPSDQTAATSKPQPVSSSRPPIPSRGRTPDAKRTPGKSPSPAQSRMPRPFSGKWSGDNVGHCSRRASPQSSGQRRLLSPAHSQSRQSNTAASGNEASQPESPDTAPTSPQTVTPKSKSSLPPPTTRKSLIPVHRVGGRGGTSGSRSRGTTPIGRDH